MDRIPLPNKFELHEDGPNKAKLIIEPLFSGYGITIGNALRRVLISSMPGAAVRSVKIKGAEHEFSTLENIKEDVVDIILNLKQLNIKVHTDEEVRLKIKVKGKKNVTAADIEPNADVEVANKDLHIATLTSDSAEFEVELVVGRGRGYVPTETRKDEKKEIGMIAVDSIYTPVKNVAMDVKDVRVGQATNFEQVTLDIETDGTISPKEAVALAGQIIVDHFSLLLEKDLEPQTVRTEELPEEEEADSTEDSAEAEPQFTGEHEVEAPAPKKRGRPKKEEVEAAPEESAEASEEATE